ncbi:6539_t:CDS:2 [Funneliformis caledonium]|uniref:6539_t:CDS:1 n=1 Tax=Funneliformis caledonium TaxID=1117310 RepID=A0A9N9G9Z9_9GLOM|nr:6539_t:CDS:2 [Funneliformis caledonium]
MSKFEILIAGTGKTESVKVLGVQLGRFDLFVSDKIKEFTTLSGFSKLTKHIEAMRSLITISGHSGRIDNEFDKRLLECFVNSLFTSAAYELEYTLVDVEGSDNLVTPEGSKIDHFMNWVNKLPERQPPVWLGLSSNAEKVLFTSKGYAMLSKLRNMKSLSDDDKVAYTQETSSSICLDACSLQLHSSQENMSRLKEVCDGELKQINHLRILLNCLTKAEFKSHLQQLESITSESHYGD